MAQRIRRSEMKKIMRVLLAGLLVMGLAALPFLGMLREPLPEE